MNNKLPASNRIKVWDIFVRIFHWTIVTSFLANMFFTEEGEWLHRWIGYLVLALIGLRIVWGFVGTPHARFKDFFPTPSKVITYLKLFFKGKEPRSIGHNPLGALMMIALILAMTGCVVTGWMQGLDRFWGVEWLHETHETFADSILVLAGLHVLGALVESFRHKENLIWSMVTGYKRAPDKADKSLL